MPLDGPPDNWPWTLAPIASIVTSLVLAFAAYTARQTYRRANFDNSPDVFTAIDLTFTGRGILRQLKFSLVEGSSRAEWEITSIQIGRRRRWGNCFRPWGTRQAWERCIHLTVPTPDDTVPLPIDCPNYFEVTFHIRRVAHHRERDTLESWCGGLEDAGASGSSMESGVPGGANRRRWGVRREAASAGTTEQ